jgi:Flp pilus assembly protein TadG
MTDPHQGQRGQATLLALVAIAFAALLVVGLASLGQAAAQRAGAQAAADAVALAGAARGEGDAEAIAEANAASIVTYRETSTDVVVTVERAGVRASARARWVPTPIP